MGKGIRKNVANRLFELRATREVPALARGVAPGSVLGPMPRRHAKLRIIAISNRPPTRRERFLNDVWRIQLVDARARKHIDGRPKRAVRIEGIDGVRLRSVHMDGRNLLRLSEAEERNRQENEATETHGQDYIWDRFTVDDPDITMSSSFAIPPGARTRWGIG